MGLGEPDLRRVCVICRILYCIVVGLGFREGGLEDLMLRSCREELAADRVGGRVWAWWSGKALELIYFGVAMQRYIAFVFSHLLPACVCLDSYRRGCVGACAG